MKKISLLFPLLLVCASMSAQRLIVRMDDIGASHAENLAVIKCYQEGIGTSAEVMVVCPWFLEAAEMLNENPGLDVGVHLVLRSEWVNYKWGPLTNCTCLMDDDGYFISTNMTREQVNLEEIEAELKAQIRMAQKHIKNVTHVTDHCMWTFIPELKELVIRVAEECGVRYQGTGDMDSQLGINSLPMGRQGTTRAERLLAGIKNMEKGKTYWTIEHPGLDCQEMEGIYEIGRNGQRTNVGRDRQDVTNAFTDPEIVKYVKENGIELISFGDVIREYEAKR